MPDWAIWIVFAVVALAIEASTTAFFTFYFAVAAAIVAVLAVIGVPVAVQIVAFGGLSIAGLWLTRPWLLRLAGDRSPAIPTGVGAMRGRVGGGPGPIRGPGGGPGEGNGGKGGPRTHF